MAYRNESLFDQPEGRTLRPVRDVEGLARFGDPDTSHDAARTITGRTERLILQHFRFGGPWEHGWTDDELSAEMPTVYPPTLKSARSRLSNKGLLVDSGVRRPSNRGAMQIVWRLRPIPEQE